MQSPLLPFRSLEYIESLVKDFLGSGKCVPEIFDGWKEDLRQQLLPFPPMEIEEANEEIHVRIQVPGLSPDQLKIEANEHALTISGEMSHKRDEHSKIYRTEFLQGSFKRRIHLPTSVNLSSVRAAAKDGIVTVTMQKKHFADSRVEVKIQ